MITIDLKKPEARLCRDAAKAQGEPLLLSHGEQRLSRGEWFDMSRWLMFAALDFEVTRELTKRKFYAALAARIEAVIERWDRCNPAEMVAVEEVAPGCLF